MAGIYDVGALRKAAEANGFKGTDEELILETARLNQRDPADLARYLGYDLGGKWGNRASAALDSYQGNMYGLGEALTGADWFRSGRRENEAASELQRALARSQGAVMSYKDAEGIGGWADYVGGLAVDSAPYLAEAFIGGAAVRGLSTGLRATAQAGRAADASVDTVRAGQAADAALARRSLLGGAAVSYPSAMGDILSNQREASADGETTNVGMAALGAGPYAAANMLGIGGLAARGTIGRGLSRLDDAAGVGGWAKRASLGAGLTSLKEGASETFQEGINQGFGRMVTDPNAGMFDADALDRYAESFVGGAALGGALGAPGAGRRSQQYYDRQQMQAAVERERASAEAIAVANQQRSMDLLSTTEPGATYGQQTLFGPDTANPLDNDGAPARSYEDLRQERNILRQERLALLREARSIDPADTAKQSALLQQDLALRDRAAAVDALIEPYERAEATSPQMGLFGPAPSDRAGQSPEEFFATGLPTFRQPAPTPNDPSFTDFYGDQPDATRDPYADIIGGGVAEASRVNEDLPRLVEAKRQQDEAQAKYVAKREDAFKTFGATTPEDQKRVKQPAIDTLALLRTLDPADPAVNAMIGELTAAVQASDTASVNRLLKEARDYASQQPVVSGTAGQSAGTVAGQGDQSARGTGAARPVAGSGVAGQLPSSTVADADAGTDQVVAGTQGVGAARQPIELTDADVGVLTKAGRTDEEAAKGRVKRRNAASQQLDDFIVSAFDRALSAGTKLTDDQIAALVAEKGFVNPDTGKPYSRAAINKRLKQNNLQARAVDSTAVDLQLASASELVGDVTGEDADTSLEGAGFRTVGSAADTKFDSKEMDSGSSMSSKDEETGARIKGGATSAKRANMMSELAAAVVSAENTEALEALVERINAARVKNKDGVALKPEQLAELQKLYDATVVRLKTADGKREADLRRAREVTADPNADAMAGKRAREAALNMVRAALAVLGNPQTASFWPQVELVWDTHRYEGDPAFADLPGAAKYQFLKAVADATEDTGRISDEVATRLVKDARNDLDKTDYTNRAFERINAAADESFGTERPVRTTAETGDGSRSTRRDSAADDARVPQEPAEEALPEVVVGTGNAGVKVERKKRRAINRELLDGPKFSKAAAGGSTVARVMTEIAGLGLKLNADKIRVVQSMKDLPPKVLASVEEDAADGQGRVQGFVHTDGRAYLIADNIKPGAARAVFLHEVGSHMGLDEVLSGRELIRLADKIKEWAERADGTLESRLAAKALMRTVTAGVSDAQAVSERIAYFVEEAVNAGVDPTALKYKSELHRWLAALVRAYTRALEKLRLINPAELTARDVVDLAYGAAQMALDKQAPAAAPDTGVKFSKWSDDIDSIRQQLPVERRALVSRMFEGAKQLGLGALTNFQLAEQFADKLNMPALKERTGHVISMIQRRGELSQKVTEVAKRWDKLKNKEQLNALVTEATSSEIHPDTVDFGTGVNAHLKPSDRAKFDSLRSRYVALGPEAQQVYQDAKAVLEEQWAARRAGMRRMIDNATAERGAAAMQAGADEATLAKIADEGKAAVAEYEKQLGRLKGPYFPLLRFGNYLAVSESKALQDAVAALEGLTGDALKKAREQVQAMRKDEAHYAVSAHDTKADALAAVKASRDAGKEARLSMTDPTAGRLSRESAMLMQQFQDSLRKKWSQGDLDADALNEAIGAMSQVYLANLPEMHALKRQAERKGIAGASTDALRAFASAGQQNAFLASRMEYADALATDMLAIKKQAKQAMADTDSATAGQVANEMLRRHALDMEYRETPVQDWITTLGYTYYLGASPAFLLMNMFQPLMVSMPVLAGRFGLNASRRELTRAYADTLKLMKGARYGEDKQWKPWDTIKPGDPNKMEEGGLDRAEDRWALRQLIQRGVIDEGLQHELSTYAGDGSRKLAQLQRVVGWAGQQVEIVNRVSTALAAYRLALGDKPARVGTEWTKEHEAAVEYAYAQTIKTQMDYSSEATARLMREGGGVPMAKMVFQFRRFQQGMLYLLMDNIKRAWPKMAGGEGSAEAQKTLGFLFAITGTMAGAVGLPFMGVALMAAGIGEDDDDPRGKPETRLKNAIHDWTGGGMLADVLTKGLPAAFGVDLSKRIGLADVASPFPMARLDEAKGTREDAKELLFNAAGPGVGMVANMVDGMRNIAAGDFQKGVEKLVPKMFADISRAERYADEGMTDSKGNPISVPLDGRDVGKRLLGLGSIAESNYYEGTKALRDLQTGMNDAKAKIGVAYRKAVRDNDFGDVREMIAEWNAKHPGDQIKAKHEVEWRRAEVKSKREANAAGIRVDKSAQKYADVARFAE